MGEQKQTGNPRPRIVVIGGGAAGLMAAGRAAEAGADVVLLEKMKRPGRKICISGKGRCNLTNVADLRDFIDHFGRNGRFLHQPFHHFFSPELISFFEELGLGVVTERGGRVFPKSGKAPDVFKVLQQWLKKNGVKVVTGNRVDRLLVRDGILTGVQSGSKKYLCDAAVLTTGGASYPATGSTGDGYRMAAAVGHRIVEPRPALVPLVTEGVLAGRMSGLNLRNVGARLLINGKRAGRFFGELVFMDYGVSGPVILTMSLQVVDALRAGKKVALVLDLKPALDENKLDARLQRDFEKRCHEPLKSVLRGLLPREMVPVCLQETGLGAEQPAGTISAKQRRQLRSWLKSFRLEVTGYRGFDEAIVTAGGVDLREVDPRTMESKRVRGLYLAGELLDLQGDTGGYNLQAAFSTGRLAGRCAAGIQVD
ncbi:MAG TPA: NAD(P)/FAD-dependent oxidoreductase [Desulfobulbus sp.]|nr:NAD(P)/FAD-dependent oxidoreductase [Desulfobulbus sp.]